MTSAREQEAIDLLNWNYDKEMGEWPREGLIERLLDALTLPSSVPCPSCNGTGWWWCDIDDDGDEQIKQRCGCKDGTRSVPPLLRWTEDVGETYRAAWDRLWNEEA